MINKLEEVIAKFKSIAVAPCMSIELIDREPRVLENKIGGKPYIPEGEKYPTNSKGEPMALLLQVDLKDLFLPNMPTNGTLEIFCDRNLSKPIEYTLRVYESGLKPIVDFPEIDLSNFIVKKGYKIELKRDICYMNMYDYRFFDTISPIIKEICGVEINNFEQMNDYFKDVDWFNIFTNMTISPDICIGGYPSFIQDDPRRRMQSNYDVCLFKMDSLYDGNKIFLGDDGTLFALISKEDLLEKNFSKTFLSWDCF